MENDPELVPLSASYVELCLQHGIVWRDSYGMTNSVDSSQIIAQPFIT